MTDIHTETLHYKAGDGELAGFLAHPADGGPRPGVLVVQEWWGVNDYIRGRAARLAEEGYAALAVDMYGDGRTADNPTDANALMSAVLGDVPALEARFRAGMELLRGHAACDGRLAAIGYCFGGAVVLHAARLGMDLAAVASFHGSLGSLHEPAPGGVKAKVLVCHGAADEFVPAADVDALKREMEKAGADLRFVAYEGALHGFTNPEATTNGQKFGLPLRYDAEADRHSWEAMQTLFKEVF